MAALTDDDVYVELIADGHHVHAAVWDLIRRAKPVDRLMLMSDALSLSGTGPGRTMVSATDSRSSRTGPRRRDRDTRGFGGGARRDAPQPGEERACPAGRGTCGERATRWRCWRSGDRGRLEPGLRADIVEMDDDLVVRRVMRGGAWVAG